MNRIAGIDLLRFLGAAAVIATHQGLERYFNAQGWERFWPLMSGTTGVTLFYVISGFLITYLAMREIEKTQGFSIKSFVLRRSVRIFPLYYLVLFCYLGIHLAGIQKTNTESLIYAFTYTYNFIPRADYDSWLGSFHTLATEEHFYILFPFLIWGALKMKWPIWVSFALMALSVIPLIKLMGPLNADYFIGRWTFLAWQPIAIGCLFGYAHHKVGPRANVTLLYAAIFAALYFSNLIKYDKLVISMAFGFLILSFANLSMGRAYKVFSWAPIVFLGNISYGLYIWQSLINATGVKRALISETWIAVPTIFLLATASWFLVEKPLTKVRARFHSR